MTEAPRRSSSSAAASFPRAKRIRKRADFVRIQTGGQRVTTRHLLLLVAAPRAGHEGAPLGPPGGPRLGLVASRKVGGAVDRNRAKRLLREAFRRFPELFPVGVDVVVILRAGAGSLGLEDVLAELRSVAPVLRRRARDALAAGPLLAGAPARGASSAEPAGSR
jgi:ribonuclease P protein component